MSNILSSIIGNNELDKDQIHDPVGKSEYILYLL